MAIPTFTPNYNFEKPHEDDFYDVTVSNANMVKIDDALKAQDDKITTHLDDLTWYEATLVNSFTGSVRYAKNAHGTVFIDLNIVKVTINIPGAVICTLPTDYRPVRMMPILVAKSNVEPFDNKSVLTISDNGQIVVAKENGLIIKDEANLYGQVVYYASL